VDADNKLQDTIALIPDVVILAFTNAIYQSVKEFAFDLQQWEVLNNGVDAQKTEE
jgi:hypothetical protein